MTNDQHNAAHAPKQSAPGHRPPPHNEAAERAVLGSLILAGGDRALFGDILATGIRGSEFYVPKHEDIFTAITQLHAAGNPVDMVTVGTAVDRMPESAATGLLVHEIVNETQLAANGEFHAEQVRKDARLRHVIEGATKIIQLAYAGGDMEVIEQELTGIVTGIPSVTRDPENIEADIDDLFDHIEELQAGEGGGISYGFKDLDEATGGMLPGDMTIISAKTAGGKTTLAMNIAAHVAKTQGRVMFSTLEMSKRQLLRNLIAAEGTVSKNKMREKDGLSPNDWDRLSTAGDVLRGMNFAIHRPEGSTLDDIKSAARAAKRGKGLDVLVVDYLQLVKITLGKDANRTQEVSTVSRELKNLASQLDCHVIALAQLNKDGGTRESASLEMDASTWLVARTHEDDPKGDSGEREIVMEKNREGAAHKVITVAAQFHYARFAEMAS